MRKIFIKGLVLLPFLLFTFQNIFGQGFLQTYDADANDSYLAAKAIDDGYLVASKNEIIRTDTLGIMIWSKPLELPAEEVAFTDSAIVTFRFEFGSNGYWSYYDFNGDLLWTDSTDSVVFDYAGSKILCPSDDGNVTLIASIYENTRRIYAEKRDEDGVVLFQKAVTVDSALMKYVPYAAISLFDGGTLIVGSFTFSGISEMFLMRLDEEANIVWTKKWDSEELFSLGSSSISMKESAEGDFIVLGGGAINSGFSSKVIKFSGEGDIIWEAGFQGYLPNSSLANKLDILPSGNIVFVSLPSPFQNQTKGSRLIMIDSEGQLLWAKELKYIQYGAIGEKIIELQHVGGNQLLMGGSFRNGANNNFMLVKTDTFGNVYPHFFTGQVFQDYSNDCLFDVDEEGCRNVNIRISNVDSDFVTTTDEQGYFAIHLPEGDYQVSVQSIDYWKTCDPFNTISITNNLDTTFLNIPVQPEFFCPLLSVDISTPFLRLCSPNSYFIHYCNQGTIPAENATIEIQLADSLHFIHATAPLLSQNGQTLTFDLGTVDVFECNSFRIDFQVTCDEEFFGQTQCTEAHIYPDQPCNISYTGPDIHATGFCQNDTIHFNIINEGEDMQSPQQYIVIEDNIILMTDDFQLLQGESRMSTVAATNGATYYLIAAQDPNLPTILGNPIATAVVEGCVGEVNEGAFSQFPENDGEPWISIDCHPIVASFDPNDKTAFPSGWTEDHLIEARTDLEYLIRFQNTGTDTAFKVVIVDTLSQFLDPSTIRPGAGSHPFSFDLTGQGVATFTFDNILLPDSTTNEAASHGFVKFSISQKPDNAIGTRIENTAYIYFDYNSAVQTNTVFHTIGEPWVQVVNGSLEVFETGVQVAVFPNPCYQSATFGIDGLIGSHSVLQLSDINGRTIFQTKMVGGKATFERGEWPAGIYFFSVRENEKVIATGKLMVR
ncbi:MAG: T9SS type A sorting domain-containing protein [Saprospiraceae bacterium]